MSSMKKRIVRNKISIVICYCFIIKKERPLHVALDRPKISIDLDDPWSLDRSSLLYTECDSLKVSILYLYRLAKTTKQVI
jgi:hypothetical protein